MIRKLALAALPLFALTACDLLGSGDAASGDADAALEAIHAVEDAQLAATAADDVAGAAAPYADDATLVAPDGTVATGAAITAMFEAMLADESFNLEPVEGSNTAWVAASGDLAVTGFTAQYTYSDDKEGSVTVPMTNQTVWRNEGGTWQIVSDINYVAAAADEAAAPATAASEAPAAAPVAEPDKGVGTGK